MMRARARASSGLPCRRGGATTWPGIGCPLLGYHDRLRAVDSHLVLAGIGPSVYRQLEATGALAHLGAPNVFAAEPRVFGSLNAARARAEELRS